MVDFGQSVIVRRTGDSLEIAKIPLCLLVAFSALFGNVYAQQHLTTVSLFVFLGVLILACGGASLNSYQERYRDRLLERTRYRPLVQGKIPQGYAFLQGAVLILAGLSLLAIFCNLPSFFAALCGIILYNGVYTKMKPWTIHAIVPGTVCGAIPPYIGWLAGGGDLLSVRAILPILLLVFWQVPHFFLVLLTHRRDYLTTLSPNMLKALSEPVLQRIFLPWIAALCVTMLTFSAIPSHIDVLGRVIVAFNAVCLLGVFSYQLLRIDSPPYKLLFRYLNFSIFLLMLIVCWSGTGIVL